MPPETDAEEMPETDSEQADYKQPGDGEHKEIRLDMTDPNIADAFADCEEGEQLTVSKKDDTEIVLTYSGGPEAKPEPSDQPETRAQPAGDATEPDYMEGANEAVKGFMKRKKQ